MYKRPHYTKTLVSPCKLKEGEPIEHKVQRMLSNKEPIKDGAPVIFTERKDGVIAAYNIRTDRWEIATEAMDKIVASKLAKREEAAKLAAEAEKEAKVVKGEFGKPEPVAGKDLKTDSK